MPTDKMLPRNRTARLAQARAAGNPAVTELESGVGNCFPGLELDLRNLERRFFPHLCVDFVGGQVVVTEVELAAARVALTPGPLLNALTRIAADLPSATWRITALSGEFSGHGTRSWRVRDLGADSSTPSDAWTAVRLLRPGTEVLVSLAREPLTATGPNRFDLRAVRVSYLTDDGAFAEMFEPGELTQSLCSPWTHDFRDCGCWYWASNHPDLVQPALPPGIAADDPRWGRRTLWLRSDRELDPPAPADVNHTGEMLHHEINSRWEDLDIVVDGREQRTAYEPSALTGTPLPPQQLIATLRYAAAVELAVMLEYLSAVYSLNPSAGATGSELRADARAARAELLRVAISEMRHLRVINGVLLDLRRDEPGGQPFAPSLGVATLIPGVAGGPGRPVRFRALTPTTLSDFVRVEAPSLTVDGLYSRILATLEARGSETHAATIRSVMAEGADHFAAFRNIQEWLSRHNGTPYLRSLTEAPAGQPQLATVQQRYERVLDLLHRGYRVGLPAGGADVANARLAMLGPGGLDGACEQLAVAGFLPRFAVPSDPRFAPIPPPA